MTQSIVVDSTADLQAVAMVMDGVSEAVGAAVSILHDTLALLGDPITVQENGNDAPDVSAGSSDNPPWGADSYGKTFATGTNGYVGMSVGLLQGGFDMARTLSEFAYGMHRAAGDLSRSEDQAGTAFA
ncbi:hypothetical protein [Nocardia salmonicida]|uniref:hypothetical protein n=1 Tax=Nocardia salmonicida TaxID=53431 RepID=UPI003CEB90CD